MNQTFYFSHLNPQKYLFYLTIENGLEFMKLTSIIFEIVQQFNNASYFLLLIKVLTLIYSSHWLIQIQILIIIILKSSEMNFYSIIPNCYQNYAIIDRMPNIQSKYHTLAILRVLSSSLRISVINYQDSYVQQTTCSNQLSALKQLQIQQNNVKIPNSPTKEDQVMCQKNTTSEKENPNQQILVREEIQEERTQQIAQTVHSDELSPPSNNSELYNKKIKYGSNLKKDKTRNNKEQLLINIPEVTLEQMAQLPKFVLGPKERFAIKQRLLRRQVCQFNEKIYNRRGKRQIRMLNN